MSVNAIKVPREVQELFFESAACAALAAECRGKWLPSLRAIYYAQKGEKARMFAWRALSAAHPAVLKDVWSFDAMTGMVTKKEDKTAALKTRKPRAPKVVAPTTPAAPAAKQGEPK